MSLSESLRFGELLRQYRERASLMQEELAERAGLSTRGISDLERGLRTHPRRDTVRRLSEALALAPAERSAFALAARGQTTAPRARLVGRAREQATLRECLLAAAGGQGGLVLIDGEAGLGKTALAEALCDEAREHGALVLTGRCYDLSETPPYGPWVDLFSRYRPAANAPFPPPAFAGHGIGPVASLAELQGQVLDFFTALAVGSASRPRSAGPRAVVVLLDDLHWADPATLELLRPLARQCITLPLLIIVAYRADDLTPRDHLPRLLPLLVHESRAVRLTLAPLTAADLAELVRVRYALTHDDAGRLAGYLTARTEGNPFFAAEVLRALEEQGALRHDDRWHLGALDQLAVPPLLRHVIEGRLARLGEEAIRLLRVAAVIGQDVPLATWAAAAETDEGDLFALVEVAEDARILGEPPHGDGIRFTHALLRETLYEGLVPLRRRRIHGRVATILATERQPDPDAVAYHLLQAHAPRAWEWLVRAGNRAEAAYAWPTAVERFAAAARLLEGDLEQREERAWLLFDQARLLRYAEGQRAIACCEEATRLALELRDDVLAAHIGWLHGLLVGNAGDFARATALRERAFAVLHALPPDDRGRDLVFKRTPARGAAHWQEVLAAWYTSVGRFRDARALGEPLLGDPSADGELYSGLSAAYAALGLPESAQAMSHKRVARERAHGQLPRLAFALLNELTKIHLPYFADAVAERHGLAGEAEDLWRRASGAVGTLDPRIASYPVLALEGHWTQAEQIWSATQDLPAEGYVRQIAIHNLLEPWVMLRRARGEPGAIPPILRAALPDGVAAAPGTASFGAAVAVQRCAAGLALAQGDLTTARQWLSAHDRWLDWSGSVLRHAEGQTLWAYYHRQTGDLPAAHEHAERALLHARAPRQPLALLAAHRVLGELDTDAGNHTEAAAHLAAALALAEACAAPYERALTLLALAELCAARGDGGAALVALAEVRTICEPLGARPTLERVTTLIGRLTPQP